MALAARGVLSVEPNPPVGCVLARAGRVVGRGWHRRYGGPHAEVEALRVAGRRARGATAYVSLEPCTTHGKTPPCIDALLAAGVARVVWAARDPSPTNGGRAAARLRAAGVLAEGPAMPREGAALLGAFRRALAFDRPWTILKWASSLDGRISAAQGTGGRLSGSRAERFVHDLRGRVEAVAVGVTTVLVDDPRLTRRTAAGRERGGRQPMAVVFDSELRTPAWARVVRGASADRPVLFYVARPPAARVQAVAGLPNVLVVPFPGRDGRVDLRRALRDVKARGVRRLLVEGGSTLAGALLREGLVDQVAAVIAPCLVGADGAPTALSGTGFEELDRAPRLEPLRVRRLGSDVLVEGFVSA